MMSRREASRIARRMTAGVALAVTLAACGSSRLDGVPSIGPAFASRACRWRRPTRRNARTWRDRIASRASSGPGARRVAGRSGPFLAWTLYLPGMGQGEAAPGTRARRVGGLRIRRPGLAGAADGRGGKLEGRLPDAASPADGLADPARSQVMLVSAAQGRLWISAREDWRQHESQGVRRHVAMLRPEGGGLLLTVRRESDSIGMLLPWYSNDSRVSQYWFARPDPDERGRGRASCAPAVHFLRCTHDRKTTDLLRRAVPVVRAGRDLVFQLFDTRAPLRGQVQGENVHIYGESPSTTPPSTAPGWKRPDAAMSTRSTPWA